MCKATAVCSVVAALCLCLTPGPWLPLTPTAGGQEGAPPAGWDATLEAGRRVPTSVTVVNRCAGSHRFRLTADEAPFVALPQPPELRVAGGASEVVRVHFDTGGLDPGSVHTGAIVVICDTCSREPTCSQDRDRFPIRLRITAPASAPLGEPTEPLPAGGEDATPDRVVPTKAGGGTADAASPFPSSFDPGYVWYTGGPVARCTDRPCPSCPCTGPKGDAGGTDPLGDTGDSPDAGREDRPGTTVAGPGDGDDPCERTAEACEELRRMAWEKESEAAALESEADAARRRAEAAQRDADEARRDAEAARDAARGPDAADEGYVEELDTGRRIYERHFEWLRARKREAFEAWKAGELTIEEYDQRIDELTGMDAYDRALREELEERGELLDEAREAERRAERARGRAQEAERAAADAAEAARRARTDADAVREAWEQCLRRLAECREAEELEREAEEERRRAERERRRAEEERRRAEEERAQTQQERERLREERRRLEEERRRAEDREREERRRQAEEETRRRQREHNEYLLRNIQNLGLISYAGFWTTPGLWDWLPDALAVPVGTVVERQLQMPVPSDTFKALAGLYSIAAALLDPCTAAGARKTTERLQERTNPRTGRPYTLEEALAKTGQMCRLMRKLKALSERAHAAGAGDQDE